MTARKPDVLLVMCDEAFARHFDEPLLGRLREFAQVGGPLCAPDLSTPEARARLA